MLRFPPGFDDHGSKSGAAHSFKPRAQTIGDGTHMDDDHLVCVQSHLCKARRIKRSGFDFAALVADPKQGGLRGCAQGKPCGKPSRRGDVGSMGGKDLVHRASRQTAPQGGIDRAGAQGEDAVPPGLARRIEPHESLPQRTQLTCSVHGSYVPILFYLDSDRTKSQSDS